MASLAKARRVYYDFLEQEAQRFFITAIASDTGLVKPKHFSGMKDYAVRERSCYDTVMAGVMQSSLRRLKIDNPLKDYNYPKILRDHYWQGNYFLDDLSGKDYVAGDANIYAFWFGIINSNSMLKKSIKSMQEVGLDDPFPLSYTKNTKKPRFILAEHFVPQWEAQSIWPQMGLFYIELLRKIDKKKAREHLRSYKKVIEENSNFMELFTAHGKPYKSLLYSADGGMLWASMYLYLIKQRASI